MRLTHKHIEVRHNIYEFKMCAYRTKHIWYGIPDKQSNSVAEKWRCLSPECSMFMHEAQHEAMPVASSSETHGGLVASDAIH